MHMQKKLDGPPKKSNIIQSENIKQSSTSWPVHFWHRVMDSFAKTPAEYFIKIPW